MTQNASFIRKIIYGCGIIVLLFPLFLLGQPATTSPDGSRDGSSGSAGGKLAQLRSEYGLSQAELGQIDPASETMKMATLGLRAFAANILWTKANYVQEDRELGPLCGGTQTDCPSAAELYFRLGVPGP